MAFTVFVDNSDSDREEGPLTPHNTEKSSTESSPKRKVETDVGFKSKQYSRVDTPKVMINDTNKENWDSKKQQYSTDRQAKKVKAIENSDRLICGHRVPLADITTLYQTKILKAKLEGLQNNLDKENPFRVEEAVSSSKPVSKSKIPKPSSIKHLKEKEPAQQEILIAASKGVSPIALENPPIAPSKPQISAKEAPSVSAKPRALGVKNPNLPETKTSKKPITIKTLNTEKSKSHGKKRAGGILSMR
ncbi:hypothetical protein HDV01_000361 [Terramyces sp. JEL0728]|nr:hypothetical protein HDV01_000361 [Terramyces sp. JEL0728]